MYKNSLNNEYYYYAEGEGNFPPVWYGNMSDFYTVSYMFICVLRCSIVDWYIDEIYSAISIFSLYTIIYFGYLDPLLLTWFNFNPSMDK